MTFKEIADMVNTIGLPYAYYSFPIGEAPDLPYVVFYYPSSDDFAADNQNYIPVTNVNLELYTENKDFSSEQTVENVLKQYGIFYDKTESYIDSERMYQILYEFQVMITEEDNNGE